MASIEKLIGKSIPLVDGDTPVAEAKDAPTKSKGKAAKARADKSGADDEKTTTAANSNEKKADDERGGRGRGRGRKAEAHPGELPPPPDCKGDTLHDTGHVPAFLLR